MTLSAPTRLNRWRGFHPATIIHREPVPSAGPARFVLMVDFSSPGGRTWWAVGVGDTLAFARDSCPTGTTWQPLRWNGVYGD